MRKWNRILILMLVMVIVTVGCSSSKRVPEGMSQQFYNDSVKFIQILEKTFKNATINDIDNSISYIFGEKYLESMGQYDESSLTMVEQKVLDDLSELSTMIDIGIAMYFSDGYFSASDKIAEIVGRISDALNVRIDINI